VQPAAGNGETTQRSTAKEGHVTERNVCGSRTELAEERQAEKEQSANEGGRSLRNDLEVSDAADVRGGDGNVLDRRAGREQSEYLVVVMNDAQVVNYEM
jgi:hypothetical protein